MRHEPCIRCLQGVQDKETNQDIWQECNDCTNASDDTVYNKGGYHIADLSRRQAGGDNIGNPANGLFKISFKPVPDSKSKEKSDRHDH